MAEIMDYLGNPQDSYKVIHIAGTSGKTSTAYYVAALLTAAGKKTGLAVSPHVDALNERVQVVMRPLPEAVFIHEMNEFLTLMDRSGMELSYFEILTAFAFWEFARQRVEYAVIEVGVGGLLDNTNVIARDDKVCVLTDIGYDHMGVLGTTLAEIAAHKAGIIGWRNTVFTHGQEPQVMQAFAARARQMEADMHIVARPMAAHTAQFGFLPLFQQRNFSLARKVVRYVLDRDGGTVTREQEKLAAHTVIPARMEIRKAAGKTIVVDGAHNPQKLHALMQSVRAQYPDTDIAVLVGFAKSRTPANRSNAGIREVANVAAHIILTSFSVNRLQPHDSDSPASAAATLRDIGFAPYEIAEDPVHAFRLLLQRPEPVAVVTGSFYLLNTIRPLLASMAANEH